MFGQQKLGLRSSCWVWQAGFTRRLVGLEKTQIKWAWENAGQWDCGSATSPGSFKGSRVQRSKASWPPAGGRQRAHLRASGARLAAAGFLAGTGFLAALDGPVSLAAAPARGFLAAVEGPASSAARLARPPAGGLLGVARRGCSSGAADASARGKEASCVRWGAAVERAAAHSGNLQGVQ